MAETAGGHTRKLMPLYWRNITAGPMPASIALNPQQRLAGFVRDYPRETIGLGVLAAAGALALAGAASSTPALEGIRALTGATAAPPAPPPLIVREIAPDQALALNAAIPIADGPNPAAIPFAQKGADKAAQARALECLASAVYYEAGQESSDGQRAVAQVVLNRVRHPAFPASVCGVVYEGSTRATGCQFTFTCDGSLNRRPDLAGWARAKKIAEAALGGAVYKPVGYATHYHADYVVPYWAPTLAKNAVVGAHIFYRWAGGWGRPYAFDQRYTKHEPNVAALRSAAILAEQRDQATRALEGDTAEAIAEIPGAERLAPSMRGDERVAVRFNLAARKASDEIQHQPYVSKVKVSDNLRWTLGGGAPATTEKPLGRTPVAPVTAKPVAQAEPEPATSGGAAAAAGGGASLN